MPLKFAQRFGRLDRSPARDGQSHPLVRMGLGGQVKFRIPPTPQSALNLKAGNVHCARLGSQIGRASPVTKWPSTKWPSAMISSPSKLVAKPRPWAKPLTQPPLLNIQ